MTGALAASIVTATCRNCGRLHPVVPGSHAEARGLCSWCLPGVPFAMAVLR